LVSGRFTKVCARGPKVVAGEGQFCSRVKF
jgi:hypothetical protein